MSAVACQFSSVTAGTVPSFIRAKGEIRASFVLTGTRTGPAELYESGGLRLLCPKVGSRCEAVLVNTGGGIVGGDRLRLAFAAAAGAQVTLTSQSAERIYRAQDCAAEIDITLSVASGGSIDWLPQETILFEGAHLRRELGVDLAGNARLIAVESYIFGRHAMGEVHPRGRLHDRWRVRREGRLIFAEDLRLAGDISGTLDQAACGGGARAIAILLYVASDAETKLAQVREGFAAKGCEWGASAWNSMLVVRLLSPSPELLRSSILSLLGTLRNAPVPRVWQ